MCKEQRAVFQKTIMEDNGSVLPCYSINLTRVQGVLAIVIASFTIIGMFVGGVSWINHSVAKVAETTFEQQLEVFHERAQPKINELIDTKIEVHKLKAEEPFNAQLAQIEKRLTTMETTLNIEVQHLKDEQKAVNVKLDTIISWMRK